MRVTVVDGWQWTDIMVITVWTILVTLLIHCHILPEGFLALLAYECHVIRFPKCVVGDFRMTFRAVIPFLAARSADGDLCVENMLAAEVTR